MKLKLAAMLPEIARHLFRKPATVEVPFQSIPQPKGLRGKPVMDPLIVHRLQALRNRLPGRSDRDQEGVRVQE